MDVAEIHKVATLEDRHWWYRERRKLLARQIRRLGSAGRALDIGAAGGGNTWVLAAYGWKAIAADLSPAAVELAHERGLTAVRADARSLPFPSATFDLVLALDVLEHIQDDHLVVAEIARILRPGGAAFITVPCDMSLWSEHDVALGHVRRYTRRSLGDLAEKCGLTIEQMRSWNVLLRPLVAWRRRRCTGSDLQALSGPVNFGLGVIVAAERYLPISSLPGVSLVLLAGRPLVGSG
jgi:SAM-dependent methyltransferase